MQVSGHSEAGLPVTDTWPVIREPSSRQNDDPSTRPRERSAFAPVAPPRWQIPLATRCCFYRRRVWCVRLYRLRAVACPAGAAGRRTATADHDRGCGIQPAASCNPRSGTAPVRRTAARRLGLSVARKSGSILLFYGLRSSRPILTRRSPPRRRTRRSKRQAHLRACS